MKAEIKYRGPSYAVTPWTWEIKAWNGKVLATGGCYTCEKNAKLGLKRFINKVTFGFVELDGVIL